MIHILLSIPAGYFVIRILMQDKYLGILMCMVIFVILGIGCDDVFILYDAWVQSAVQNKNILRSLETRLDWFAMSHRRSEFKMFNFLAGLSAEPLELCLSHHSRLLLRFWPISFLRLFQSACLESSWPQ
jgi:hypothetical protein